MDMNDKIPVPKGSRGEDYARFVHRKKEEANWTCSRCGWQAKENNERINIIAHHPDPNDLFRVEIVCADCHPNRRQGR